MEEEKDLRATVKAVVEAYKMFLSDSLALDWCKVERAWRKKVTSDAEYRSETRKIKAESYRRQLDELEEMAKGTACTNPDMAMFDMGDPASRKEYDAAKKEYQASVATRLKIQEVKRDLLKIGVEASEGDDEDAMNFYFTPITAEAMKEMVNQEKLEIYDGSEGDEDAFKDILGGLAKDGGEDEGDAKGGAPSAEPTKSDEEPAPKVQSDGTLLFGA